MRSKGSIGGAVLIVWVYVIAMYMCVNSELSKS